MSKSSDKIWPKGVDGFHPNDAGSTAVPDHIAHPIAENMPEESPVASWVGRSVIINDQGLDGTIGEIGTVLAVDDTPWRPSGWVRVDRDPSRNLYSYMSVDLCWLDDTKTGETGPAWGTQ